MAAYGANAGTFLGPLNNHVAGVVTGNLVTYTMPTANNGWAARIMAYGTRDFKAIYVNFSAVSAPGSVEARIETIDATSGKPSGTLYDASATKTFTPSGGWNTVTFDTLPTAGTTAGAEYALVLLKTDTGTTCTLNSRISGSADGTYPVMPLTASDISTRSNFAEAGGGNVPVCYFKMEDDAIEAMGCCPITANSTGAFYGSDIVVAQKIVLPVGVVARAVMSPQLGALTRTGTPAGDIRFRIFDSGNSVVSGSTVTVDKDSMTNANARGLNIPLNNVTLAAGTYRLAFDSASSANGSNCFALRYATLNDAALQGTGFCYSQSTNASTSFTWSDTTTRQVLIGLSLDSITAGSGGGLIRHPGMMGGLNG